MWGLAPVKGAFAEFEGSGTVDASGAVTGTLTVASASVNTKNAKRDTHLRSADFFDSTAHPTITVQLDSMSPTAEGVVFTGTVTVRDQTKPLSLPATVVANSDTELSIDGSSQFNRAEFGMTWNQMGMASMTTEIAVHATLVHT